MHCPVCFSADNIVARSSKSDNMVIRIRQCRSCQTIWSTSEPAKAACNCGQNAWSISNVEHSGPDGKIRLRTCTKCGNKQQTVERKITGNKQHNLKLEKRAI